jgi:hypothetical protein
MSERMSLRCFIGVHRPLLASIIERADGFHGLCEGCGLPIERGPGGRWTVEPPLAWRDNKAAQPNRS